MDRVCHTYIHAWYTASGGTLNFEDGKSGVESRLHYDMILDIIEFKSNTLCVYFDPLFFCSFIMMH